ncbi:acyl-CoA dehydrogenase family protein [Micromonospora sp. DH14]|uniref:acyl-CoA dehydrogenase family protein n=1 Tax=Micromonospora sp. DH14 TaxID=3040120 RepID=UPI0024436CAA|nr:acyl-CoA dehydrogenase family protein [Micromonospora sp. DH14]MDG9672857.1 acyl-CoA dehydrogenase family protein [Micromonospora sp. DH14]
MDFSLTADQRALAERVRTFTEKRITPFYQDSDRQGQFRPDLLPELAAEGLFALRVPVEYGGLGLDAVSTGVALEELARGDLTACYPVLNAALVAGIITANGTPEQRSRWLPAIARGDAVVAFCMTEPSHGTDAAAVKLRAEPNGPRDWRLVGEKTSIMLGAYATHGMIFARTSDAPRARGVTAFYARLDDQHVVRSTLRDLGSRSGGRSTLVFDGLPVQVSDVVGETGLGFAQGMRGFDYSRALIALMAVSVAQAALDDAISHAQHRRAFDKPLGQFQGIAFPLAECATYLHAARLVAYEALWRNDAGLEHRLAANMAKWWAPKVAVEATHQALLTLGHFGYSEEQPIAQRLRDLIGTQLADGTANATKLVVARELLGREYAP